MSVKFFFFFFDQMSVKSKTNFWLAVRRTTWSQWDFNICQCSFSRHGATNDGSKCQIAKIRFFLSPYKYYRYLNWKQMCVCVWSSWSLKKSFYLIVSENNNKNLTLDSQLLLEFPVLFYAYINTTSLSYLHHCSCHWNLMYF